MAIKSLGMQRNESLIIDLIDSDQRVLVGIKDDQLMVVNDKCRHRGGPLHLCYMDSNGRKRCLWYYYKGHDRPILGLDKSDAVNCVFLSSKQQLNIICNGNISTPWPIKKILS